MNAHKLFLPAALAALLLAAAVCRADPPDDFKCGPIDCDTLKNNPDARYLNIFAALKDGKSISDELKQLPKLREAFWNTYPDQPTAQFHEEAREKFAQVLFEKDLYYLEFNVMARVIAENPNRLTGQQEDLPSQVVDLMGGQIDGGIPQSAQPEFYAWVNAVRDALGPIRSTDDVLKVTWQAEFGILGAKYRKATNPAAKEYQAYVMERDWAEYAAINKIPAGYDNKTNYGIFLHYRFGQLSLDDATRTYAGMVDALTPDVVEAAADQVRTAPKTPQGLLVAHVPSPVKLGPGGDQITDWDMPIPPGVIGVYSDPLVALQRLATADDPHRYALFLLKHQYFTNRKLLASDMTEWSFAKGAYAGLVLAFGEHDVLQAAEAVRTAVKRLAGSGTIINQNAIGATRNDPFEAFEDILCRKNPRGYVRAALIAKENILSPEKVDLDAAWQKLTSPGGQDKLLAAAQKIAAAEKPNLAYIDELDYVHSVLDGSISLDHPVLPEVDNPEYLAWKNFAPGAKVTYVSHTWQQDPPGGDRLVSGPVTERHSLTLQSIDDRQAVYWLTEYAFDTDGSAHPPYDTENAYLAKLTLHRMPGADQAVRSGGRKSRPTSTDENTGPFAPAPTIPGAVALTAGRLRGFVDPASTPTGSGQETLEIQGRKIPTRWQSVSFTFQAASPYKDDSLVVKVWTSDAVPGCLVRKTIDHISPASRTHWAVRTVEELSLESFAGFAPAEAASSSAASTGYVPPPVALSPAADVPAAPAPAPAPLVQPSPPPSSAPAASEQTLLLRRFRADQARFVRDKRALAQWQRKQPDPSTPLPDDIRDARDGLDAQVRAASTAIAKRNTDEAKQHLQSMEDALTVIENYVTP